MHWCGHGAILKPRADAPGHGFVLVERGLQLRHELCQNELEPPRWWARVAALDGHLSVLCYMFPCWSVLYALLHQVPRRKPGAALYTRTRLIHYFRADYALLPVAAVFSSKAAFSLGTSLASMSLKPPDGGHVLLLSMLPGARTSPAALKAPTGHPSRYAAQAAKTASPRRRKCARISGAVCAGGRRSIGPGRCCSPRHPVQSEL